MKISINWLDEWVEVADLDAAELAPTLTMAGLEVEGIDRPGHGHDDIVVGQIQSIEEHPDADRLVVCRVDVGEKMPRTIVCGATNMTEKQLVPTALPGSSPPGTDFDIQAREVMGVESEGMLCSAEELELGDDSDGLMILDGIEQPLVVDLEVGDPVFEALRLKDTVLEIDLTPNRADCLSHLGVAREVAALYDRPLNRERTRPPALGRGQGAGAVSDVASLTIEDREGCPHYRMAVLEDVRPADSPLWLQTRLQAVGIRPVNWIVDVTNYVLMDVGQPLHAFDLDRLAGPEIVVRRARQGETIVGIDHVDYELSEDDLVVADAKSPVAIAGVIGGADTEVTESTSRILLECAWFEPTSVRRSAKRHGLHTDSSHRFERGVDPGACAAAVRRAVDLMVSVQREVTGESPTVRDGVHTAGAAPEAEPRIELEVDDVHELLGVQIGADKCRSLLESIGVDAEPDGDDRLVCTAPTFRRDLRRPVDLIEEVARLHGYDEIPAKLPEMTVGARHEKRDASRQDTVVTRRRRRRLEWMRQRLLDQGLLEAINYSFMGDDDLERLRVPDDDCRRLAPRLANPLVASRQMMRTSLIPSLLDNLNTNFARKQMDVALFEFARRYFEDGERPTVAIAVTGRRRRHFSGQRHWDFFDLKGLIEALATPWALENPRWQRPEVHEPFLHPGVQAQFRCGDAMLGVAGRLHPEVAREEGFEQPVFVAELDLEPMICAGARRPVAESPPKFPAVVRDFALLYDEDRPYAELREAVEQLARDDRQFGAIFEKMELFDVYTGEQVPEGRRSLAIKITYRSGDKTLEDADVEPADRQLLSHLEQTVDARLR